MRGNNLLVLGLALISFVAAMNSCKSGRNPKPVYPRFIDESVFNDLYSRLFLIKSVYGRKTYYVFTTGFATFYPSRSIPAQRQREGTSVSEEMISRHDVSFILTSYPFASDYQQCQRAEPAVHPLLAVTGWNTIR